MEFSHLAVLPVLVGGDRGRCGRLDLDADLLGGGLFLGLCVAVRLHLGRLCGRHRSGSLKLVYFFIKMLYACYLKKNLEAFLRKISSN